MYSIGKQPYVLRIKHPCFFLGARFDNLKPGKALSIKLGHPFDRANKDVPIVILLDVTHLIPVQAFILGELQKLRSIKPIHAIAITTEPNISSLILMDTPNARIQFRDDLAGDRWGGGQGGEVFLTRCACAAIANGQDEQDK